MFRYVWWCFPRFHRPDRFLPTKNMDRNRRTKRLGHQIWTKTGKPKGYSCALGWFFRAGIREQLDYIEGMGFDCIWITPVVTWRSAGFRGLVLEPQFGNIERGPFCVSLAGNKLMAKGLDRCQSCFTINTYFSERSPMLGKYPVAQKRTLVIRAVTRPPPRVRLARQLPRFFGHGTRCCAQRTPRACCCLCVVYFP